MNKQQVEALIDRLADKKIAEGLQFNRKEETLVLLRITDSGTIIYRELSNDRHYEWLNGKLSSCKIIGHPIYLHRVLAIKPIPTSMVQDNYDNMELINIWKDCGLEKSLQEIVEDSGWESVECIDPDCPCGKFPLRNDSCAYKTQLKSSEADALFTYLEEIGL